MSEIFIPDVNVEQAKDENNRCVTYGDLMKPFEKLSEDLGVGLEQLADDFCRFVNEDETSDIIDLNNALNQVVTPKKKNFKDYGSFGSDIVHFWGVPGFYGELSRFFLSLKKYFPNGYKLITSEFFNYEWGVMVPRDVLNSIEDSTGIACPVKMSQTLPEVRAFTFLSLTFEINGPFDIIYYDMGGKTASLTISGDAGFLYEVLSNNISSTMDNLQFSLTTMAITFYDIVRINFSLNFYNDEANGVQYFPTNASIIIANEEGEIIDSGDVSGNVSYDDYYMIDGHISISKNLAPEFLPVIRIGFDITQPEEINIYFTWDEGQIMIPGTNNSIYLYGNRLTPIYELSDVYLVETDGYGYFCEGSTREKRITIPASTLSDYSMSYIYVPLNYEYNDSYNLNETIYVGVGYASDFSPYIPNQNTTLDFSDIIVNMEGTVRGGNRINYADFTNSFGGMFSVRSNHETDGIFTLFMTIEGQLEQNCQNVAVSIKFFDGTARLYTQNVNSYEGLFNFNSIALTQYSSDSGDVIRAVKEISVTGY